MWYVRRSESTSIFGQMLFDVTHKWRICILTSPIIPSLSIVNIVFEGFAVAVGEWNRTLICYTFRLVICLLKRV